MNDNIWNRDELYKEVWEQPLVKLALKYGISAVALGKICRKLKVPLPGRGYWAKKEFGKRVKQIPLPEFKNPPVLRRVKSELRPQPQIDSSDPELVKIAEVEARPVPMPTEEHRLVTKARTVLTRARTDEYDRTQRPPSQQCLDIRVSKGLLDRALAAMNRLLFALEADSFPVQVGERGTSTEVFGQTVRFGIEEDLTVKERREEKQWYGTKKVIIYERSGKIAFLIWTEATGQRRHWGDGKTKRLEDLLPPCLGALLRAARQLRIEEERRRQRQLEWERKEREREERRQRQQEEESRLKNLEECTANWHKATRIRAFVSAFEKACEAKGESVSPDSKHGQWIVWARGKANWFDPLVEKENSTGAPKP
jgi:hypothetical protein